MDPEKGDKIGFEERLKKVEETLESIISALKKIVEKQESQIEPES